MAASTELSPKDVVNALRTLTDKQTSRLFYHLDVPLQILANIEARHNGEMHTIYCVQVWFDNDLEASWEKIVAGLKEIGMCALSQRVASRHNIGALTSITGNPTSTLTDLTSDPTSPTSGLINLTSDPTNPTSDPTNPPSLTQISCVTQPPVRTESAPIDPVKALSLVPSTTHPSTSISDRVRRVKMIIEQLQDSFTSVVFKTRSAMCKKESLDPEFIDNVRDYLFYLPLSNKGLHARFFRESEDDILKAESIKKLFAILGRYCNYLNYEIILHLVKKFCEDVLKKMMLDYCKSLKQFEMTTTVDVYCRAISAGRKLLLEFKQMALKIEKPSSECTLHEIRKLKEEIAEESALPSYSVYIESVAESSVLVVLRFPPGCFGWVLAAMTPAFLHTHCMTEVVVDGKQLTVQHGEREKVMDGKHQHGNREKLDYQLCCTSRVGDVVRVASLLNSGADVETLTKYSQTTPLHLASMGGHLQTVRLLLQRGARVDSRSEAGDSALMIAARWGKTNQVLVELVKAGGDLNLQNRVYIHGGDSALMTAIKWGRTEAVVELVKAGAILNLQNNTGESALIIAARRGRTEIVVELVKAGANLNLQSTKGDSAVILATVRQESGALRELVRAGADLNLQNEEGLTALMISARNGWAEVTDILLTGESIGTDIQENSTGWSALFFSAKAGDVDTTQLLLRARANALLKDKNGLTALDVAAAYWQNTTRRYLCELLRRHIETFSAAHSHHSDAVTDRRPHQDSSTTDQDKPSHQDSSTTDQDRFSSHQDSDKDRPASQGDQESSTTGYSATDQDSTTDQDRPADQDSDQDSSTTLTDQDRPFDQDISTTDQDIDQESTPSTPLTVPPALLDLVNKSNQMLTRLFNQLDRRLKSADEKERSQVIGEGGAGGQRKRKGGDRPHDKKLAPRITTHTHKDSGI